MKTVLYLLLGFVLLNSSPTLAETPPEQGQQPVDTTETKSAAQIRGDDC